MAGNSWQSPVAGEPSWGTPHTHFETLVSGYDPATTSNIIVTASSVPAGSQGIFGYALVRSTTTAGRILRVENTSGKTYAHAANPTTAIYGSTYFMVPIDANKQFSFVVSDEDVNYVNIVMGGYFI